MSTNSMPLRLPIVSWAIRFAVFLTVFLFAFGCGLVALSFFDDLVHYQSQMTERTNLLIGVGFGGFCGLGAMIGLARIWSSKS